jgi:hypothetical protein
MSTEAFVDFYENYLSSPDGEALRDQLQAVQSGEEFLAVATQGGRDAGYEFTEKEAQEVMRASEAQMVKAMAEADGELTEEQLAAVAGGALSFSPTLSTVRISTMPTYLDPGKLQFSTVMCPW